MSDPTPTASPAPGGGEAEQKALVPLAPKGLDSAAESALVERAEQLAGKVQAQPGDRQLSRQLGALGAREQQSAAQEINLLKTRVGTLLKEVDGEGGEIPKALVELRHQMDEINPHVLSQPGKLGRLLGRVPGIGKVLKNIAVKYESVQTQIDAIMAGLRAGKDRLLQDNAELEQLYQQVKQAQLGIQQSAYVGELLWQKLDDALIDCDPGERQKLQAMMHRVAMRVQDLRTMEQVNLQFFVSIDMTLQNNDTLAEQVDRTVMVTQNLLTVGLAIQAALAQQKKVAKAVKGVQETTAAMLEANAAAIGRQTVEIGEMQNNPVLALESVKKAHNTLLEALDKMDEIRQLGTEKARTGIAELNRMSAVLEPKVEALEAARDLPEIEAKSEPAESEETTSRPRE